MTKLVLLLMGPLSPKSIGAYTLPPFPLSMPYCHLNSAKGEKSQQSDPLLFVLFCFVCWFTKQLAQCQINSSWPFQLQEREQSLGWCKSPTGCEEDEDRRSLVRSANGTGLAGFNTQTFFQRMDKYGI